MKLSELVQLLEDYQRKNRLRSMLSSILEPRQIRILRKWIGSKENLNIGHDPEIHLKEYEDYAKSQGHAIGLSREDKDIAEIFDTWENKEFLEQTMKAKEAVRSRPLENPVNWREASSAYGRFFSQLPPSNLPYKSEIWLDKSLPTVALLAMKKQQDDYRRKYEKLEDSQKNSNNNTSSTPVNCGYR